MMLSGKANRPSQAANPFIVSTSLEKPNAAARKLIRSHVMRGKNRRGPRVALQKPASVPSQDGVGVTSKRNQVSRQPSPSIGTDFAVTRFADDMAPYMQELVFKFFTVIKESLYPIELCMNFDTRASIWFHYLRTDVIYLHSLIWSTQSYHEWVKGSSPSKVSMTHQAKTLGLLQKRLDDGLMAISDTTLAVVVTLVMMAALTGEPEAATKHMGGLHKMVLLRGGIHSLGENKQLQIKLCRADLGIALLNDTKPLFSSEVKSWERYFPQSPLSYPIPHQLLSCGIDRSLAEIWSDLEVFCGSANFAYRTKEKMNPETFQDQMIFIEYRLMSLSFHPAHSNEMFRLGMLAYVTAVFLQTECIKIRFAPLCGQLCDSLFRADWANIELMGIHVWLLFVAGLSATTPEDDHWLLPLLFTVLQEARLTTWESVRATLRGFLWIDALHDIQGRRIFDRIVLIKTKPGALEIQRELPAQD